MLWGNWRNSYFADGNYRRFVGASATGSAIAAGQTFSGKNAADTTALGTYRATRVSHTTTGAPQPCTIEAIRVNDTEANVVGNSTPTSYSLRSASGGGRLIIANLTTSAAAVTVLGYRREELIGQHYSVLVHPDDRGTASHVVDERRTGERASRNIELRLRSRFADEGKHFEVNLVTLSLNAMGIYSHGQPTGQREFIGTHGIARDISARRRAEAMIAFNALHDSVTELPNRQLFRDRLEFALIQARRHSTPLTVMQVDLDRFKWVNDSLGHPTGNDVLRIAAQRIEGCLQSSDTVARLEADEFALLLPIIRVDS